MHEPLSPELALIDPELAARARAALPEPGSFGARPSRPARPPVESVAPAPAAVESTRPYPLWARVTAALWLLVLGILIGGAAIPHAQDTPRVLPPSEEPDRDLQASRRSRPARSSRASDPRFAPAPDDRLTARGRRSGPLQSASRGAIAQLGERLDRTQEVAGSSPASFHRRTPNGAWLGQQIGPSEWAAMPEGTPAGGHVTAGTLRKSDRRQTLRRWLPTVVPHGGRHSAALVRAA